MDLTEIDCQDGRWIELAQDRGQWRAFVLAVLNLCVLLPESQLIGKMDLREIGCEDGMWIELAQDRVKVLEVLNLPVLPPQNRNTNSKHGLFNSKIQSPFTFTTECKTPVQ